jgi:hypothetical protein
MARGDTDTETQTPIDPATLKRVSDLAPDLEIGETLDDADIEGKDLILTDYAQDERTGDDGNDYTLSVFTLEDGRKIHTSSKVVAERMDQVIKNSGDNVFPMLGTFTRVQSKRNPRNRYWTLR